MKNYYTKIFALLLIILCTSVSSIAQGQILNIKGIVCDDSGEPLVGVGVMVKSSNIGTLTNELGEYSINIPSESSILLFNLLGFVDVEVVVGKRKTLDVEMTENKTALDELVFVGYGTAKRKDLVGAIDEISAEDISGRTNSTLTRTLQGQIPNLNISMVDGKPDRSASYNIRGITSIGAGGSALVLIDGVQGEANNINPADVESVIVLKDASSAAIYGARGAFGVVLITTKKASKGEAKVNYNGSFSIHQRTIVPNLVTDGLQWTDSFLEAFVNNKGSLPTSINNVFPYSTAWHENLRLHSQNPELPSVQINENTGEYEYYGSTNWDELLYKDFTTGTDHTVSVTGGNKLANFYVSGRFFSQDGIYNGANTDDYLKGNLRAKGEIQIKPWLSIDNNFDMSYKQYHYPVISYDSNMIIQRNLEHQGYPVVVMRNPDGSFTDNAVYSGMANIFSGKSYQDEFTQYFRNTLGLNITPIKDVLSFRADVSYSKTDYRRERVQNKEQYSDRPGVVLERGLSKKYDTQKANHYVSSNISGTFSPKLGNRHSLKLTAGWNLETYKSDAYYYSRDGFLFEDRPNFDLMDGINYSITQGDSNWSYVGLFYRANYSYKGKYLLEASGRYDGSSKFPTNQQWGFFPSVSVGWRINEEKFMQNASSWIDNLKLRLSVGSLGNGNVSPYKYLSTMSVAKSSVIIGDNQVNYTAVPGLIPDSLTWETVTTYNVGLDLDLFENKFSVVADVYQRNTTDMYTKGPTLPGVLGASVPKGNYADLKTNGWEFQISWKDDFKLGGKDFFYGAKFMLWDSRSWITKYNNETGVISDYYVGKEIGDIWGYQIEGLFTDYDDVANHADQNYMKISDSRVWQPGDLKFKDVNGDDVINKGAQTLDDSGDLTVIGNTSARYQYGINLNASWYGLSLSVFLQGVGKKDWYPGQESAFFWGQYNRPYSYALTCHNDRWTKDNPNPDAYWPRLVTYAAENSARPMATANDRYMQDASYLRVKSLRLDYTLPKSWLNIMHIQDFKIFWSGENLFTFSNIHENFDPEVISGGDADLKATSGELHGYSYPMLKTNTFGINITF